MTPADVSALISQFGLPVAMLLIFGWLILTGKLVTGSQLATMTALFERERADRIAAEQMVQKFATANAEVAEAVADLSRTVVSGTPTPAPRPDPYQERMEGRRARG